MFVARAPAVSSKLLFSERLAGGNKTRCNLVGLAPASHGFFGFEKNKNSPESSIPARQWLVAARRKRGRLVASCRLHLTAPPSHLLSLP